MVRKHTRRAAKAAFAVSIGVALLIGLTVFSGAAHGGVAGAEDDRRGEADDHARHEELHRGVHPRPALRPGAAGEGLQGRVQGELRLVRAREHGDQERQDELLPGVHGDHRARPRAVEERSRRRPHATYKAAKKYEQKHGLTLLKHDAVRRQRHLHDADDDGEQARREEDLRPEEGEVVLVRRASRSARRGSPACSA